MLLLKGKTGLLECQDAKTNELVYVVVAFNEKDGETEMVPLAKLFNGNPYEELNPPDPEKEDAFLEKEKA